MIMASQFFYIMKVNWILKMGTIQEPAFFKSLNDGCHGLAAGLLQNVVNLFAVVLEAT